MSRIERAGKWTVPTSTSKLRRQRERRQIAALEASGWRCHWCGRALMLLSVLGDDVGFWVGREALWPLTLDHVVPLALLKGVRGRDQKVALPVVACCRPCNQHRAPRHLPSGNLRYDGVEYRLHDGHWVEVEGAR